MSAEPLTFQTMIQPSLMDHNGHMNVSNYVGLFDNASWNFLASCGLSPAYFEETGSRFVGKSQKIDYLREVVAGDIIYVTTRCLSVGRTSLTIRHSMHDFDTSDLVAQMELTIVQIDVQTRRSKEIPAEKAELLRLQQTEDTPS